VGVDVALRLAPTVTIGAEVGYRRDEMAARFGVVTFTIRRAIEFDLESFRECLATAFEPYRQRYIPDAYRNTVPTIDGLRNRLSSMHVLVGIAPTGNVIGTIASAQIAPAVGYLRGLAVRPLWQGLRVADGLLLAAEQQLRRENCTQVTLDTVAPLERARRFYEKHAFLGLATSVTSSR
jgi:GNAT superfamily N-acetyltransferase